MYSIVYYAVVFIKRIFAFNIVLYMYMYMYMHMYICICNRDEEITEREAWGVERERLVGKWEEGVKEKTNNS